MQPRAGRCGASLRPIIYRPDVPEATGTRRAPANIRDCSQGVLKIVKKATAGIAIEAQNRQLACIYCSWQPQKLAKQGFQESAFLYLAALFLLWLGLSSPLFGILAS